MPRVSFPEFGKDLHARIGELPLREDDVPAGAELSIGREEGERLQIIRDVMRLGGWSLRRLRARKIRRIFR